MNIVFLANNDYFKPMCITISSLLDSTKIINRVKLFIIDLELSYQNKVILTDLINSYGVKFYFVEPNGFNSNNFASKTHIGTAAYAKIYIPELIQEDYVLYLDSDLMIKDDLLDLWHQRDPNVNIHAVLNPFYNYDNKYIGIDQNKQTFNSGVMLMNLKLMREQKASEKLENFINENNSKTKLLDQPAFNSVFKDDWKELDFEWNFQVKFLNTTYKKLNINRQRYYRLIKAPKIIHYTSASKPWHFKNAHPYKKDFLEYYERLFGEIQYDDWSAYSMLRKLHEKYLFTISSILNIFGI